MNSILIPLCSLVFMASDAFVVSIIDISVKALNPDPPPYVGVAPAGDGAFPVTDEEKKLHAYMEVLSRSVAPKARAVLPKISSGARRLLALRYYLVRSGAIRSQWTWSHEEITRYRKSAEYRDAISEVAKVKRRFAELNPGYRLGVNTEIRSVNEQINIWNSVGTIKAGGEDLKRKLLKAIADTTKFTPVPDKSSLARFRRLLTSTSVGTTPSAAVPGLSQHGQLRAFDFIIKQGDGIVAGASIASVRSVWDSGEWTKKLKEAITQSSDKFSGPLASPYEPWHYTYTP